MLSVNKLHKLPIMDYIKNFDINSINIDSYIDDHGDFIINKIIIKCETTNDKENIESIIKNELGFEVEVV